MRSPFPGRRRQDDRGSVTAEFAVAIPAVLLVLVGALGAMQVAGEQLRLQAASADAARSFGRGDENGYSRVAEQIPGASVTKRMLGDLVCADARAPTTLGLLSGVTLVATSCALRTEQR